MVAFPLGKLVYLGVRQLSKPIARQLQRAAVSSAFFRKYVCAPPAQGLHKLEMFVKMRLMGVVGPTEVQPLKEEKAVELGAEILGEMFLYSIAAAFLVFEYYRGVRKERALELGQDTRIRELHDQLEKLNKDMEGVMVELRSLEQSISSKKRKT